MGHSTGVRLAAVMVPIISMMLLTGCEVPQAPNSGSGAGTTGDQAVDESLELGACPAPYVASEIDGEFSWPAPLAEGVEPAPTCAATSDSLQMSPDKTGARQTLQLVWNVTASIAQQLEADVSARMDDAGYTVDENLSFDEESYWFTGSADAPEAAASLTSKPTPDGMILVFSHTIDDGASD